MLELYSTHWPEETHTSSTCTKSRFHLWMCCKIFQVVLFLGTTKWLSLYMTDCWRHGVHRGEELHSPRCACSQHFGQRWHPLQDSRLWLGQDHRIRIHSSRRYSMYKGLLTLDNKCIQGLSQEFRNYWLDELKGTNAPATPLKFK